MRCCRKAHDEARRRAPEAWEEHKKLNKLGHKMGTLPQSRHQREQAGDEDVQESRSGRKQPRRKPQWESEHSGSPPTTPDRTPSEPEDETPTIKVHETPALRALAHVVERFEKRTGWSPTELKGFEVVLDALRRA
jgi:hypothetical protein